ncbi:hypothetical protein ANRL1_00896 [Anaerolineae bacterium]|nr:hypothetical protein ANRL1_00896 [Anaerolineae bacterium]
MAQNEMKAMRGMPLRVRSMEGLGAGAEVRSIEVFRIGPLVTESLRDMPVVRLRVPVVPRDGLSTTVLALNT